LRPAPETTATIDNSVNTPSKSPFAAFAWPQPDDSTSASSGTLSLGLGPPFAGPSLQCLLCVWRK
jgi:hypothetical protein